MPVLFISYVALLLNAVNVPASQASPKSPQGMKSSQNETMAIVTSVHKISEKTDTKSKDSTTGTTEAVVTSTSVTRTVGEKVGTEIMLFVFN